MYTMIDELEAFRCDPSFFLRIYLHVEYSTCQLNSDKFLHLE
jgi:hypothetical protein